MAKKTVADILRECKAKRGYETDTEFAEALGVSKQLLSNWLNEVNQPEINYLKVTALLNMVSQPWKALLAVDLLRVMNLVEEIPCTCFELQGDNEYCPKHFGAAETVPA